MVYGRAARFCYNDYNSSSVSSMMSGLDWETLEEGRADHYIALWQLGLDQDFLLSCPLKADSKIVHLICWEWLQSFNQFFSSICSNLSLFHSQHAYNRLLSLARAFA